MTMTRALELAREILPSLEESVLGYVLWNETGFPTFWRIPADGDTDEDCLRTQLREFGKRVQR